MKDLSVVNDEAPTINLREMQAKTPTLPTHLEQTKVSEVDTRNQGRDDGRTILLITLVTA